MCLQIRSTRDAALLICSDLIFHYIIDQNNFFRQLITPTIVWEPRHPVNTLIDHFEIDCIVEKINSFYVGLAITRPLIPWIPRAGLLLHYSMI